MKLTAIALGLCLQNMSLYTPLNIAPDNILLSVERVNLSPERPSRKRLSALHVYRSASCRAFTDVARQMQAIHRNYYLTATAIQSNATNPSAHRRISATTVVLLMVITGIKLCYQVYNKCLPLRRITTSAIARGKGNLLVYLQTSAITYTHSLCLLEYLKYIIIH